MYQAPMNAVQRFTLDTEADDRADESWADVKDPKEKKKMQNRIAQKSYRSSASPLTNSTLSRPV
jgi:hypothetical protein